VGDLLVLARAQRDAEALSRELVDLRDLLGEVVMSLRPLAEGKRQTLEVRLDRSLLVEGDAMKLRQAMSNLLENAVTYTPADGTIWISGSDERGHVQVQIRDTGPGIAPEHLPRLFEPFYRVDRARAGDGGHSGLGLALAAWIVRAHGGHLGVESHLGTGSVFTITLPAAT
jgi:two-component system phosphate regulon sensor histidine kinase PhoR